MTNPGGAHACALRPKNSPNKTRTSGSPARPPVHTRPPPYHWHTCISARSARGNPKNRFSHHQPPRESAHTQPNRCVPTRIPRTARRGRRRVARSTRSTPTCRTTRSAPSSSDVRTNSWPLTSNESVIRNHPLHVHVPRPPNLIQNPPKCTCTCTCTYLSVDRPPTDRRGPKHRNPETFEFQRSRHVTIIEEGRHPASFRDPPSRSFLEPTPSGESLPRPKCENPRRNIF